MATRHTATCVATILFLAQAGRLAGAADAGVAGPAADELKRLSLEALMELRVSSVSRQQSTVGQASAAVCVISGEDIRRSGASSIPELLRRVPGMSVARVDGNKWAVSARGFNDRFANKLLVQIDGRTVYSPIFSGVFWDTVDYPLTDIERIEVIRGPGASTWGANAVNGVINILTKSASDTQGASLDGGGGTHGRTFGTIRYGGVAGDAASYRVYAKALERDAGFGASPAPFDAWSASRAGVRADWRQSVQDELTVQGDYFHSDAERVDFRPQPTPPFVYTNAEQEISSGADLLARWTRTLDDDSNWSLQAYWDRIRRRSTGGILVFDMDTLDVDFQHETSLGGRHRLVWGVGYRVMDAELDDSRFDGFILAWDRHRRRLDTPSAFVQDQISLAEDTLSLTLGTKLERNDLTGVEVQPSLRLLWTPGETQTVWASVSRAVRIPTLFEDQRSVTQTPVMPAPGITIFPRIVANPELQSEEVLAYEFGYRSQIMRTLSLDAALFYNVYEDLKVFAPAGSTTIGAPAGTSLRLSTHRNQMRGESYGLELATRWSPLQWWQLYGAYSLSRLDLRADASLPTTTRAMSEAAERQSPEQQAYLQSSLALPGNTALDLIARFVDPLTGFQQPVDAYVSMDVRLAWRPRENVLLELVGQDLLDDQHLEVGGSVLAGPLHEIQRSIYGRVAITW